METSKENKLFITDEVRDYIKEVNNSQKNGNKVITEVMSIKLYMALCKFIENIYIYDTVDKKNTLKNYIINMICSDKFDTKTKQSNLNIFIQSINPIKDVNGVLKKALTEIYTNIYKILEKDEEEQKNEINKILDRDLNSSLDKTSDIEFHNVIKKELDENPEDAKVYFEFFKIIECDNDLCQNPKELKSYKNKNARFSLIRDKTTNHVKLLEVFNGKKVKIYATEQEIAEIESYKNSYLKMIEDIAKPYYDEIVKMITTSWGWVWGDDGIIQNTVDKSPEIIQSLYKAVKDIIKNFINISDDYKNNMWNYVSTYFNGENGIVKNVKGALSVIGDSTDSIKSFIKTTFIGAFALGGLTALIRPDMLSSAVDTMMSNIKDYSYKIMNRVKNYTLDKVLGKAENDAFENRYEEIKANTLTKINNLTEDLSVNVEKIFGVKTELETNKEKLNFLIRKLFDLPDDVKTNKYQQLLEFIKKKGITLDGELKNDKERFDSILNKLDKLEIGYIEEFINFVSDTFDIKAELLNDFDKLKLMADKVKNFTIDKKNEYLKIFSNFFAEYGIEQGFIDENDELQNVLNKIENSTDDKINMFVEYIELHHPEIKPENFLQTRYKIHSISKKINSFTKEQKKLILNYVKTYLSIEPKLENDIDIIQNMLIKLKNQMEIKIRELIDITKKKYSDVMEKITDFVKEKFEISVSFDSNKEKLKCYLKKLKNLPKDKKKKYLDSLKKLTKDKKEEYFVSLDNLLNGINLGDINLDGSELFDKIIDIFEKVDYNNDENINKILKFIEENKIIDTEITEFDKIEYLFEETINFGINKKEEYFNKIIKFIYDKFGLIPKDVNDTGFNKIQDLLLKIKDQANVEADNLINKTYDLLKNYGVYSDEDIGFEKGDDYVSKITKMFEKTKNYGSEKTKEYLNNIVDVLEKLIGIEKEDLVQEGIEEENIEEIIKKIKKLFILLEEKTKDTVDKALEKKNKMLKDIFGIDSGTNVGITEDINIDKINFIIQESFSEIDKKKTEYLNKIITYFETLGITPDPSAIYDIDKIKNMVEQFKNKKLTDYEEIKDMAGTFGLNFTEEYDDTVSEIKSATRKRLYELANQYAIEFPYFTNNIDKLEDVLFKLQNKNINEFNEFFLYNSTVEDININEFCISKSDIIDKYIKYSADNLKIFPDKNYTNTIDIVNNINLKISKEYKDTRDDIIINHLIILSSMINDTNGRVSIEEKFIIYNIEQILNYFDIFGKDNCFLFTVKEIYKIEPNKYLTNNVDKIKDVIRKLKSVNLASDEYNSSVNKTKYKFLKYFDEHFSIKSDNPNKDIFAKCEEVRDKIIKPNTTFIDYKEWIDSKYTKYNKYNTIEIKKIIFDKFKNCFGYEYRETLILKNIIDEIILCDNNNGILYDDFDINIYDMDEENIKDLVSEIDKYLYDIKIKNNIEPSILNDEEKEILLFKAINDPKRIAINILSDNVDTIKEKIPDYLHKFIDVGDKFILGETEEATNMGYGALKETAKDIALYLLKKPFNVIGDKATAYINARMDGFIIGGGHYKSYTVDNLKQNLLKLLVKMTDSIELSDHIPSGELIDVEIDNDNEPYVLKKETIMDYDEMERYREEMQLKRMRAPTKMECTENLHKTNLFKNSKKMNENIWDKINKKSDVSPIKVLPKMPDLTIFPNNMQILNEASFMDINNYQIGGNDDISENNKFVKTEIMDIKIQYSYEILSLLKKALRKLNKNGIYLEDKTLKDIKYNMNNLKNAEKDLSEYAISIVNAGNINNNNNKNEILNKKTLQEYIDKHNTLLEGSDRIAIKLNKAIFKLLALI